LETLVSYCEKKIEGAIIVPMAEKLTKDEKRALRRAEWEQEEGKKEKEEKIKKYGILSLVVLVALAVGFIFYKAAVSSPTPANQSVNIPEASSEDIQTGPKDAKATLVEYSDFQCPACAINYPLVKQLSEEYKGKLNIIYRFFPLESAHPNAKISAQAAYAAHLQGKFWEMESLLFTNQNAWAGLPDPKQTFVEYAKQAGLDTAKFEADLMSEETIKVVETQRDSALSIGIQSTPSFFLNGEMISPQGYEDFKALVENALSSK
jgi:protein-disulfide isomerase